MENSKLETSFQKYFSENKIKKFNFIQQEIILYNPWDLLKRDLYQFRGGEHERIKKIGKIIGRIDVFFRFKEKLYGGEIKYYPFDNTEFWDALKILGYVEYYNWQIDLTHQKKIKPAILIPFKKVKLEHKIVGGKLGIKIFGIEKKSDIFNLQEIN